MDYLIAYIATAVVFFAIDFVWLAKVAKSFYWSRLGGLLRDKPNLAAASGFYAVYLIGIVIFAVVPALQAQSWTTALVYGALFGFFAYATYDMTNLATLKGWSVSVAVVDIAWGTALTGASATFGYLLTQLVLGG